MNLEASISTSWMPAAAAVLIGIALAALGRTLFVRRLESVFARTPTDLDDIFLAATRRYLPVWILLAAAAAAARLAPVADHIGQLVNTICALGFIVSLTMAGSRLGTALLARGGRRSGATVAMTSLAANVVRIAIFTVGSLLVLSNLGISITPLLTALGIGSLAVALALQPTLSNLFAGLHLTLARPIRVGDFVELENGTKGSVEDIGWRATRIRELPNDVIVVPNARMAEMIVRNYDLPEPEQAALVQVGVAYASDLSHVEQVTVEVAREVLKDVPGGVHAFEPFIRYHTLADSSINFTVILRVNRFTDRYLLIHEFIKRLRVRYDEEGIEIPFPQRVLHGAVSTSLMSIEMATGRVPGART